MSKKNKKKKQHLWPALVLDYKKNNQEADPLFAVQQEYSYSLCLWIHWHGGKLLYNTNLYTVVQNSQCME